MPFLSFVNGIYILEKNKALNIKYWIVSTHAVKICDHLNKKWSGH